MTHGTDRITATTPQLKRGFTIIELLIALTIGLFILAGVAQITINSKRSYIDNREISSIHDNVRYALDILAKDFRAAGYRACANASPTVANIINSSQKNNISGAFDLKAVSGIDGDNSPSEAISSLPIYSHSQGLPSSAATPDAVTLRAVANSNELSVRQHNPASAVLSTWQANSFVNGTAFILADASCQNLTIFMGDQNTTTSNEIKISSKNCTKNLSATAPFNCENSLSTNSQAPISPGSSVFPYVANTYFIGLSTIFANAPALKRRYINVNNGNLEYKTEEIAVGVENMQLTFGVDANRDGKVDSTFKTANNITKWDQVIAMNIALTLRSFNPVGNTGQTDGYLRKNIETTITLRNTGR